MAEIRDKSAIVLYNKSWFCTKNTKLDWLGLSIVSFL